MKFDSDAAMRQAPQSVQHWYFECQERLKTTDPIILAGAIQACAIDQLSAEISLLGARLFPNTSDDLADESPDLNKRVAQLESASESLLKVLEKIINQSRGHQVVTA
jgi:outer membrane murein-binding lipoprotein Lpp